MTVHNNCRFSSRSLLVALLSSASIAPVAAQQLAFPTAEGFGKNSIGGRGGSVYVVSNLNDSGSGSLRECAEASGPRTCVFAVSGEIKVKSRIRILNPYITIAGQTAPGDGIQLTNRDGGNLAAPLNVETDHAIIRHLRLRPGPSQTKSSNVDAILINGSNLIFDHVSMSWGTDETLNAIGNNGTLARNSVPNASNITIQWSMIYESLRNSTHTSANHSRSTYIGYGVQDVTFHHNVMAHSTRRNPNLGTLGQFDFVNNVTYNAGQYFAEIYNRHGSNHVNWVGNIAIAGPDTLYRADAHSINLFYNNGVAELDAYVAGNIDINRLNDSLPQDLAVDPKDSAFLRPSPAGYGILSLPPGSITNAQQAYKDVLAFAGAVRPNRDSADARLVNDIRTCTGRIIDDPSQRGGWPVLQSGAAPADADRDGMADGWERANGFDPGDASDRNRDADGDGYTNLEEYLNELAGDHLGQNQGRGSGANADPRCGRGAPAPARNVAIKTLSVSPAVIRPGEQAKITFEGLGDACKKSWSSAAPTLSGVDTLSPAEAGTITLDYLCSGDQIDDSRTLALFVTNDGLMPRPTPTITASRTSVNRGDPVTLTWQAGPYRDTKAGECVASGGWSGIKSVAGAETIAANASGPYALTCVGPGGSATASITIQASGAPPAPTPPPTTPQPPTVSITALDANKVEGNSGATAFSFRATRAGDLSASTTLSYQVEAGTADASDFGGRLPAGDTLFAPGVAAATISVPVAGDTASEPDETFDVRLIRSVGATITTNVAAGQIVNDDGTAAPTPAPAPAPGGLGIGAKVRVNIAAEHVRNSPGGVKIELKFRGASGVIVAGPGRDDNVEWWRVDFDSGADGYVRAAALAVNN